MRAKLISLQYFLSIFISALSLAQGLEVSIRTDKTVYGRDDSIYITAVFKNTTGSSVKFLKKGRFETNENCFHVYNAGDGLLYKQNRTGKDDFITLGAGAEYVNAGYYHVFWPCESMPPAGSWNLEIDIVLSITPNDNKYYVSEGKEIIDTIQVNDAWTGKVLSTGPVSVIIKSRN